MPLNEILRRHPQSNLQRLVIPYSYIRGVPIPKSTHKSLSQIRFNEFYIELQEHFCNNHQVFNTSALVTLVVTTSACLLPTDRFLSLSKFVERSPSLNKIRFQLLNAPKHDRGESEKPDFGAETLPPPLCPLFGIQKPSFQISPQAFTVDEFTLRRRVVHCRGTTSRSIPSSGQWGDWHITQLSLRNPFTNLHAWISQGGFPKEFLETVPRLERLSLLATDTVPFENPIPINIFCNVRCFPAP